MADIEERAERTREENRKVDNSVRKRKNTSWLHYFRISIMGYLTQISFFFKSSMIIFV